MHLKDSLKQEWFAKGKTTVCKNDNKMKEGSEGFWKIEDTSESLVKVGFRIGFCEYDGVSIPQVWRGDALVCTCSRAHEKVQLDGHITPTWRRD